MSKLLYVLGGLAVLAALVGFLLDFPLYVTSASHTFKEAFLIPRTVATGLQDHGLWTLGLDRFPQMVQVGALSGREGLLNGLLLLGYPAVCMFALLIAPIPLSLETIRDCSQGNYFHAILGPVAIVLVVGVAPLSLALWEMFAGYQLLTMPNADALYLWTLVPMLVVGAAVSFGTIALTWRVIAISWGWLVMLLMAPFALFMGGGLGAGGGGGGNKEKDRRAAGGAALAMAPGVRATRIHSGTTWLDKKLVGYVNEKGDIYKGTNWLNEERIGRIDAEGRIFFGADSFRESEFGHVDSNGDIHKGTNWFNKQRIGRIDPDGTVFRGSSPLTDTPTGKIE